MRTLNATFIAAKGNQLDDKAAYLFLVNQPTGGDRDKQGFMPRGMQFGYINTSTANVSSVIAHELGHGAFKLYHTFNSGYGSTAAATQNKTDNLLDYKGGTDLAKWQWDQMYDPAIINGVFDGDKEAEYATDGHYYTVQLVALMMGFTPAEAYKLGAEAENPDSYVKAPWDMEERYTYIKAGLQQEYHALTGRTHGVELALTTYALLKTHRNESNFHQYLLHRFGDCFGHINTSSTTYDNININDYVNAVERLFDDYVKPKIKSVSDDYKPSQRIDKTMSFLKIYYNGSNLLTILSIEGTKKELVQQLLHSYSEDIDLNFPHNNYLRNELIEELFKLLPDAVQNSYDMYGNDSGFTKGHAIDSKLLSKFGNYNPDDIGGRKELYFYYISKLIDLMSSKYNKQNINKPTILKNIRTIINNATDGTYEKRLDAILAFECEYYKNPDATNYEFSIPIKYNPAVLSSLEKYAEKNSEDFIEDAEKQRDIMLSYLANRLFIDKISWKPKKIYIAGGLDRNNYPKYVYITKPDVLNGKYDVSIIVTTDKKSLKIQLTKK